MQCTSILLIISHPSTKYLSQPYRYWSRQNPPGRHPSHSPAITSYLGSRVTSACVESVQGLHFSIGENSRRRVHKHLTPVTPTIDLGAAQTRI